MENQLSIGQQNQKHLQAYLDYVHLTGDTGDDLMNEKEYEEFKEKLRKNAKNRIYASWRNKAGVDCKMIGPETKCFCDHRYKQHNHLEPINKQINCKQKGCKCKCFFYIPIYGSQDLKCLCHHSYRDHDVITQKCKNVYNYLFIIILKSPNVKDASNFLQLGHVPVVQNITITLQFLKQLKNIQLNIKFSKRQERIQQGKATDDMNRMAGELDAPMGVGGLMNFQSLCDQEIKNQHFGFNAQKVEQYQQQMIKNDKQQQMIAGNNQKMLPGQKPGKGAMQVQQSGGALANQGGVSALDLFMKPHSFGGTGKPRPMIAAKKKLY